MKTIYGKLIQYGSGRLIFEDLEAQMSFEITDKTFKTIYRIIPGTGRVGGIITQTSENVSLEYELDKSNSIQMVSKARIPIEPCEKINFTFVEIFSDDQKLMILYTKNESDSF